MKYDGIDITNAISIEMGRKLVALKQEGKLENLDKESLLGSIKLAQLYYEKSKRETEKKKERRDEWMEIGIILGVIDE